MWLQIPKILDYITSGNQTIEFQIWFVTHRHLIWKTVENQALEAPPESNLRGTWNQNRGVIMLPSKTADQ